MKAVVRESVRHFGQNHLNGENALDVVLTPPWGTAWLLDVGDLPDEEIEEQVAWELQQKLEAPLEEHIYAWHPVDERVYAVVIRPEMLEFWDKIFHDTGIDISSISLRTGIVDKSIEQGADLLPLYQLWADRHGVTGFDDESPAPEQSGYRPPPELDDDDLEDDLEDLDAGDDRVDPLDLTEEDEDASEEALGAILEGAGSGRRGKRKKRRWFRVLIAMILVLLLLVTGGYMMRDRIVSVLPTDGPAGRVAQALRSRAGDAVRGLSRYVSAARSRIAAMADRGEEPAVEETRSPADERPIVEEEIALPGESRQTPPLEQDMADQIESGTEQAEQQLQPESQQTRRSAQPTGARIPVVTVPLQTVPPPPVQPSAGLTLQKMFSLADEMTVDLESVILQGRGIRAEVAGNREDIREWTSIAGETPGGLAARTEQPVTLAAGTLVELDLESMQERFMTVDQFRSLAASQGLIELEPGLWRANRYALRALFNQLEQRKTRPFRLSMHRIEPNVYHLVMLP
jgi:hypothetical protein